MWLRLGNTAVIAAFLLSIVFATWEIPDGYMLATFSMSGSNLTLKFGQNWVNNKWYIVVVVFIVLVLLLIQKLSFKMWSD